MNTIFIQCFIGTPGKIRTCDPLIRSLEKDLLYVSLFSLLFISVDKQFGTVRFGVRQFGWFGAHMAHLDFSSNLLFSTK
jgi:hypothetical protein